LLASRPDGWEYLLFAGDLLAGRDRLEPKWRDQELGLPGSTRVHLPDESRAIEHARAQLDHIQITINAFNRLFTPEVHERAFGASGQPGDAGRIEHLAMRIIDSYEELLDWAAGLRACAVPDRFEALYELLPQLASNAIQAFHNFVDEVAEKMAQLPALLDAPTRDTPIRFNVTLVLDIDEAVTNGVQAELQRLSTI
jgi:hypothetical protein